jgi:hypothetical protein
MAPVEIFRLNRIEAYCIRTFRVVYLNMPTRKTGIVNRTLVFESAPMRLSTERLLFEVPELLAVSSSGISNGRVKLVIESNFGRGMSQSKSRHKRTEPMAMPHGIQGDISMVTDARKEASSSAI